MPSELGAGGFSRWKVILSTVIIAVGITLAFVFKEHFGEFLSLTP